MLRFPDLDTLQLALTSGAVPDVLAQAPAGAAFEDGGAIWVEPNKAPGRASINALKRLGVRSEKARVEMEVSATCWAQILPARRDRAADAPGPATPVYFDLPGEQVPSLVGEVIRLGNDRQSIRWLADGEGQSGGAGRALLRVVGPPYYALLRAIDRADDGPIAYVERAPRVLVEVGYTHPLVDRLRPPVGQLLLIRAPHDWATLDEGKFRDIYEITDFQLPKQESRWKDVPPPGRLRFPLRLARGGGPEAAELWVVRERAMEQLDELVAGADDRLVARLAFAVAEAGPGGAPCVVLRVRPSKLAPPVLVLDAVACRPYLRLPNLFLPVGTRLHPPLRRDAVSRLLAEDPARITWLNPLPDGQFSPESLPEEAFRPLDQWVDYVLDREHQPLNAWVQSARFDFEPFVCRDDEDGGDGPRRGRSKKGREEDRPEFKVPAERAGASKAPRASGRRSRDELAELVPVAEPGEAARRLGELEAEFLALEAPLDAEERRPIWREMAVLNAGLGRSGDVTACWANAVWELDRPPADWLDAWAQAEAGASGRPIADAAALDRLLGEAKPSAADLRGLALALMRAAGDAGPFPGLRDRLDRLQHLLERHEGTLPARVAWLAWLGLTRLAGDDVLALARARDRLLERLHQHGLSRDLDLPSFLRLGGGSAGERSRLVTDHLVRLAESAGDWVGTGRWTGPYTRAISDLIFAFGLARLGQDVACRALHQSGLEGLKRKKDVVVNWLSKAFDARIRQALEGHAVAGPLPADLVKRLEEMSQGDTDEERKQGKAFRYKIDRLREHSRILEPNEKVDPYRHWHGHQSDAIDRELGAVVDVADRAELADRMGKLLEAKLTGSRAALQRASIVGTGLEVSFRLGDAFARRVLEQVVPAVDGYDNLRRQAELLERGIHLAAHFDQIGHVRAFVARFDALLAGAGVESAEKLEPLLGQCFRGLRKLGMRDETGSLLDRIAGEILGGQSGAGAEALRAAAAHAGREAIAWARTLRLLLHVAAGWFYFGQADRAWPVLEAARSLLLEGELESVEQTHLACGYVRALGHAPVAAALPRVDELFARLERVHDTYTTGSHYSLSRLDVVEAVVLTLASEDFTLDEAGRRWLEDDEYLVRRRVHRDVRRALGQEV